MGRFDALSNLEEQTTAAPPQASVADTPKKETRPAPTDAPIATAAHKTHHDTVIPRHHETTHDTTLPRHHDAGEERADEDIAEVVRKAVKHFGKEAATHRFTLDEKNLLAD